MANRCLSLIALLITHCAVELVAHAAHLTAPTSAADKAQSWRAAAAQTLAARADANSLATAAALGFAAGAEHPKGQTAALEWAARASELAPESPVIGWLRLRLCAAAAACDIREPAATLRWVDADNGAAWLPTLAAAQKEKDTIEVERVLADMAQAAHFDLYWNPTIVMMFDALKAARGGLPRHYLPSDLTRLEEAQDVADLEVIPPFLPLVNACREPLGTERRENCLKLSKSMQRGDTVIAQLLGFNLERRLLPPDGREARAAAERRRVLEGRIAAAGRYDAPLLPWLKNARARERLAVMRAMHREEDAVIAILRAHNQPIDPPEEPR